ncbi:MAG: hypothetical protein CENE_02030 [Candidatus Celerinatantimonas neptuna]|nr:MAG: hypothetical protein CENE_02030 [Candidatus Celerinatantimonas neptuna]
MNGEHNHITPSQPVDFETKSDVINTTARPSFGARGWTIIIFQAILFWIAAGVVTHGLNVILPAISQTYHLNYNTLLALATPASWVSILAGPICAWICEKKGAKFNTVFCLIACGICFGLLGYSGSLAGFTLLFAGVCFFGTGFAYVGGTAIMAHWFVKSSGMAFGWCTIGQTFSSALFVPTLAVLFSYLGIRNGFWGISAMMYVMAILVVFFIANRPEDVGMAPDNQPLSLASHGQSTQPQVPDLLPVKQLLHMPDVWLIGIATGAIYIMLVGIVSQIVPRLIEMGYVLNTAILYMSVSALFGTLGAYGWGWLNQRVGIKSAILIYTLWWIISIAINLFSQWPVMLWISLLMIGFSLPGATNLSTALIATKFPRHFYIRAIGIIHPIQSIVRCFAFSILAFGLSYLGGYSGAYVLLIGVGVLTLFLIWRIDVTPVENAFKS